MTTPLSRRTFLRGAAGISLALPMLEAMEARAQPVTRTRRLVIFFTPDGFYRPTFDITGTETAFTLSPTLASLAPLKSKLTYYDNIDQKSSMDSSYGNNGHDRGMAGILTGAKTSPKRLSLGMSIDESIARRIGAPPGGFASLVLGVQTANVAGFSRICFTGADTPIAPQENPQTTFNRIVGATSTDPAVMKRRAQRKMVVDYVLDDYKSLRSKVGTADKLRLDAHVNAVETLQTELNNTSGASCSIPTFNFAGADYPRLVKLQTDLAVLALKCDLTRVVVIQCSKSVSRVVPNWLMWNGAPIEKEHHDLAHYGDGANDAAMLEVVDKWYGDQFAYLCNQMNAVTEAGGFTLLDNSMTTLVSEYGLGTSHSMVRTPYLVMGSGGGLLKTGRFIKFPAGTNHNKVLVTMDRVMGGTSNVYGDPAYAQGPLPGVFV
ncbi:MAG: DUF1552 domain-containing protein [Archangiaceae bacterium]|nr:DUF1552 domain-containing protein [Archangiaceae bacterium]